LRNLITTLKWNHQRSRRKSKTNGDDIFYADDEIESTVSINMGDQGVRKWIGNGG